jgi:hypothetical protein
VLALGFPGVRPVEHDARRDTYLTSDIAAIPLFWVIPLALYLLTFILAFARRPPLPHRWMVRAFPMASVVQALLMNISAATVPLFVPLHLATFFIAAMVCHVEFVQRRPNQKHLTAFYLAVSCGGVLGGVFNGLVAPVVFDRIAEYPLALVLACLALPKGVSAHGAEAGRARRPSRDWLIPLAPGIALWGILTISQRRSDSAQDDRIVLAAFGLAAFACYAFRDGPRRLALGIGAVLLAGGTYTAYHGRLLFQHRSYFGVVRVTYVPSGSCHRLIHGQTKHREQSLDPARRDEPLTYYYRMGPIGQVFATFGERFARSDIAIVGLGAGTLAAYAQAGQRRTFYEIDPIIARIARDGRYLTFLRDCRAASTDVVLGDARLRLRDAPERGYGLIVLDAFSSDAIPTPC